MSMSADGFIKELDRLHERLEKASHEESLRKCLPVLHVGFEGNFLRAEDSEGASWPQRVDDKPHPMLILTGKLLEAVRDTGNPGNVSDVSQDELITGVRGDEVPYAAVHQNGSEDGRIPPREYLYATEDVLDKCEEIVADGFLGMI